MNSSILFLLLTNEFGDWSTGWKFLLSLFIQLIFLLSYNKLLQISEKPTQKCNYVVRIQRRENFIQSLKQVFSIPTHQISKLQLLPPVVQIRLTHIFVISPPITEPSLSIYSIVQCPQPISHVHRFGSQIVLQIVWVLDVLQIQQYSVVSLRGSREVILVKRRAKGFIILQSSVSLEGFLIALSVDLEHQVFIPFIECEHRRQVLCIPNCLPINVILFPNFVNVIWDEYVASLGIHFKFSELQKIVPIPNRGKQTNYPYIISIRFRILYLYLPFQPCQEELPKRIHLCLHLPTHPITQPFHPYQQLLIFIFIFMQLSPHLFLIVTYPTHYPFILIIKVHKYIIVITFMSVSQQKGGSCAIMTQPYFSSMTGLPTKKDKNKKISKSNLSTFIQCHSRNNIINTDKLPEKGTQNCSAHISNITSNKSIQKNNSEEKDGYKSESQKGQSCMCEQTSAKREEQESKRLPFAGLVEQQISKGVHQFMIDSYKRFKKCKILKTQIKERKFSGPDAITKKFKYL